VEQQGQGESRASTPAKPRRCGWRPTPCLDPGGRALSWLAGLTVFATVLVVAAASSGWALGEQATPYAADLQVVRRPVSEVDNGFELLLFKANDVYWPDRAEGRLAARMLAGQWGDGASDLAVKILEHNAMPLERFDHCLRRPQFQFPQSRSNSAWLRTSNEWLRLGRVVSLRAMAKGRAGRGAAAVEDAMRLVRLGHRIEAAQGNLLHWNSGSRLKLVGLSCLARLLPLVELPSLDLVRFARELRNYPAHVIGLQDAYRWEYGVLHRQVDSLASSEVDPMELGIVVNQQLMRNWNSPEHFDPDHTKQVLAAGIRLAIHGLAHYEPGTLLGLFQQLAELRENTEKLNVNPIGVMFYKSSLSKGILVPLRQVAKENTHLAALRTLLALKAWQKRNGSLPRSLAQLVPTFLDEVPKDPFNGQPLRYSRSKKIVYSVGEDRKDAGGSGAGAGRTRVDDNEPTFHIGF